MSDLKSGILKELTYLANDKKSKKEIFRYRAYVKAIQAIKETDDVINSIEDLDKVSGLAKGSIREKIEEFIKTGEIVQVKTITKESKIIETLSNIYGIGPSKANYLVNNAKVTSIDDLKDKLKNDESILNNKQKLGLKYYEDLLKRIPRKEMDKHETFLTDFINVIDENNELIYEVVGSYRRKEKNSGDIDVLCTTKNKDTKLFNKIIKHLENDKYITETLAKGDKKFMGISKLSRHKTQRRLDMIYTNYSNYAFTLLYFTGSGQFNIEMRNYALTLGYSLSEYGFKKDGQFVDNKGNPFETEQDIFNFLGMKYVNPEDRKGGIIKESLL
tara:strand:+ start:4388 stop:5377 length:990 start_codon:yes stop_codon:yes gene_type:complete